MLRRDLCLKDMKRCRRLAEKASRWISPVLMNARPTLFLIHRSISALRSERLSAGCKDGREGHHRHLFQPRGPSRFFGPQPLTSIHVLLNAAYEEEQSDPARTMCRPHRRVQRFSTWRRVLPLHSGFIFSLDASCGLVMVGRLRQT